MLAAELVACHDVLGRSGAEDGEKVLQHVATGNEVGVALGWVAEPGLRGAEVEETKCDHFGRCLALRLAVPAGCCEEIMPGPILAGQTRVGGSARHWVRSAIHSRAHVQA
jgi:hypothetical protein